MVIYTLYTQGPKFVVSTSRKKTSEMWAPVFRYGPGREKLRLTKSHTLQVNELSAPCKPHTLHLGLPDITAF